jgi:hypothetical protein
MAPSEITKAYGTVLLTVAPGGTDRTRARLTLSAPVQSATELRWAIIPGRCGSNSLPVLGFDSFPVLEIGSTGRGQLDVEIPFALPNQGTYHVNVYWRGQQLSDVMTCGNLKLAGERGD